MSRDSRLHPFPPRPFGGPFGSPRLGPPAGLPRDPDDVPIVGRSSVLDRFGVPIQPGDQVVYRAPVDLAYEVVAVEPGPQGSILLSLGTSVQLPCPPAQPILNLMRVGKRAAHPQVNTPAQTPTQTPAPVEPAEPAEPAADLRVETPDEPPTSTEDGKLSGTDTPAPLDNDPAGA